MKERVEEDVMCCCSKVVEAACVWRVCMERVAMVVAAAALYVRKQLLCRCCTEAYLLACLPACLCCRLVAAGLEHSLLDLRCLCLCVQTTFPSTRAFARIYWLLRHLCDDNGHTGQRIRKRSDIRCYGDGELESLFETKRHTIVESTCS